MYVCIYVCIIATSVGACAECMYICICIYIYIYIMDHLRCMHVRICMHVCMYHDHIRRCVSAAIRRGRWKLVLGPERQNDWCGMGG